MNGATLLIGELALTQSSVDACGGAVRSHAWTGEFRQSLRNRHFRSKKRRRVDTTLVGHDEPSLPQSLRRFPCPIEGNPENRCLFRERVLRKKYVPRVGGSGQHMQGRSRGPSRVIQRDSKRGADAIGGAEADPSHLLSDHVGIVSELSR